MESITENGGMRPSEAAQGDNTVTSIDGFRRRSTEDQGAAIVSLDLSPLVKPGIYSMVYVTRSTTYVYKTPKLAIRFRIVDPGEFSGIELERWYNCKKLIGKAGKNGGFVPKRHGDFLLEYCTLFPTVITRDSRLDRISFRPFVNSLITGKVGTVKRNNRQRNIPDQLQYSVIRELIKAGA